LLQRTAQEGLRGVQRGSLPFIMNDSIG
jgi:hypothetical protein